MGISDAYLLGLLFTVPFVAFLYASVGHGGASGYIALMYLFSVNEFTIKPVALVMNLFVAAIAFYHYYMAGYFKMNLFIYFAVGSVPMALLGGYFTVSALVYKILLGLFLLFAMLKLGGQLKAKEIKEIAFKPIAAIGVGAIIGLVSGLIGIGGGIILSPILLLLHWASVKESAAIAALFIWVNSAAGLTGQLLQGIQIPTETFYLVLVAIVGGFFGSYFGSKILNTKSVQIMLILVLGMALSKLILSL
ncbi:sulfite exporter TauE/SafE family protein [Putridiphycobacter roseus]|uniref:Probable membrane transporter protein n=1 Tax=Putridiphycobacter roseus TaxID=2219161 RepID=A0A2W1N072_9FLAO|nr:sulfite exporter TauE/SafE family protein [Putridiphycobacter roseus]PZE17104.1 sulfite exporter TauE/SafE family protein [Putridiphycobacter roseus]